MATFITTVKFTQQGIKDIANTTKRSAAIRAGAKKVGAKVKDVYWTLGDHDGVLIFEAPDDETATAFVLHIGSAGNVHTSTVRAFSASEVDNLLSKLQGS
ncbi:MAG: GYD domain-containing protein [Gemmataceae bacterium]